MILASKRCFSYQRHLTLVDFLVHAWIMRIFKFVWADELNSGSKQVVENWALISVGSILSNFRALWRSCMLLFSCSVRDPTCRDYIGFHLHQCLLPRSIFPRQDGIYLERGIRLGRKMYLIIGRISRYLQCDLSPCYFCFISLLHAVSLLGQGRFFVLYRNNPSNCDALRYRSASQWREQRSIFYINYINFLDTRRAI